MSTKLPLESAVDDRVVAFEDIFAESSSSPHTITMTFDMTDIDGIIGFEYARLGSVSHLVIWSMWDKLTRELNYCDQPEDGEDCDVCSQTEHWLSVLLDLMDKYDVPLEVE